MRMFADTQLQAKLVKDMQDLYVKRSQWKLTSGISMRSVAGG